MNQLSKSIALYGPPGSGKSTLIDYALTQGIKAVDLEKMGNTFEERYQTLNLLKNNKEKYLFGAADLPPEAFEKGTFFILLLPPKEVLLERVQKRGDTRSHKWIEAAIKVYTEHVQMAKEGKFDFVIDTDISVEQTLVKIRSFASLS